MSKPKSKFLPAGAIALSFFLGGLAAGCGGNPNEDELLRTTTPGTKAEPESVASRRERTKAVPQPKDAGSKAKPKAGRS
jgi:hypothetical protein